MEDIKKQLKMAVSELFGVEIEPDVTLAPEETGADYASNVAMKLAKVAHKSPMEIAEELRGSLSSAIVASASSSALSDPAPKPPQAKSLWSDRTEDLAETDSDQDSMARQDIGNPAGTGSKLTSPQRLFEVEVAAPGFLNFRLDDAALTEAARAYTGPLDEMFLSEEYQGKMVVAEFSDPNPFKVLHVGHLYTSVVGDSISRILELSGAKVVRANFGGDVGLHVAKTMFILLCGKKFGHHDFSDGGLPSGHCPKNQVPKDSSLPELTIEQIARAYVEGTRAYEEDEAAKAEITKLNKVIYALAELGEEKSRERLEIEQIAEDFGMATTEVAEVAELYWQGRALSYDYFKDFYAQIGVKFDKFYPESSVADKGVEEVKAHVGTTYEESDGAIVYRGEKVGLHTRVFINREGVPTYETKDVGLIFTKWADWQFDESVVITGNEQTDYMKVVLASVKEYAPELVERTEHLTHGMVKLPGNVKMSSRKGNFLKAVDVIEMVGQELTAGSSSDSSVSGYDVALLQSDDESLRETFSEQCPDGNLPLGKSLSADSSARKSPEVSQNQLITLAAIKYAFLKYKMGGDIVFDPKESVSTTGNSGVYLLYAAVRARKVLERVAKKGDEPVENLSNKIVQEPEKGEKERVFERRLNKKIVQYGDVIRGAVSEKAPYKICGYLYELAQEFSRFYENVKVARNEREEELAEIVRAYLNVMEHGLEVLGIEVPESM